ncbi:SpaA isopeptide-forming pilin-related protein [Enterococcus lactis]|uniref:SpaA isopeptide-forming pilin-related protein n=1 Tax=Enterococcus TaxID=1350 RepID=UPI0019E918A9|nr:MULTISPECIES: SpaA isopeptide-forming pilin-related protein [Enterococcus]EGP5669312.1 VWA domain-containing protein [Enterococcus faecium]MDG4615445.1 SpaA isopeptide-forming pilin-related protein [Enterococcus lactis]MDV4765560.1 SpaA isopeptide-forming pilin-related protein [Enterococcus faecium]MEB4749363.1 SpaA isopeptide-forming pilin-related protein [Enterococcus sp. E5-162]NTQ96931.1 VWA domain-containing protein [Enterococcus faecium]
MTTTGKKLKVVFVLILLSLSNILPVTAIAEAADNPTMLEIISAEITSDQSGKKALNVKLNANNNSTKKVEKEIGLVENYLSDVERKEGDGYAYQVKSGKTMLEISPNTKQTINLSLPIDPTLYHSQTNKLIVDNKEYDITDAKEHKKETEVSTSNTDETKEGVSEENENSVSPFTLPRLSLPAVTVSTNQTISTEYTTDDQGTYPKANWQPTGNTNVLDHQGNKNGSNQWDGINSWDGDPNDRTHSYIEYGGTGNQADYAIRKFAKETTTPGLFDVYLNARGNVQKDITPLDLVLVVDWSGSMNDNDRIGEVKIGVDRFVDTLADSGITDKINMGYVGYSSEGHNYSNGTVQMGSFDSVKNQVKSITPSWTNGGTFTQKGLRDAGDMLSVPNGHKKVIVLLTDGVPTFSYKVQRVHAQSSSNYYGTQFSNTQDRPGNTSLISRIYDAPDQNNLSRRIDSTFIATIGEAMALKERGIEIHGLGIQLQSDPAAGLSKAEVESRMRKMVSADEKGDLYYESADHATDISEYLAKKAVQISATVSNGQINDPIAEPFIYQPGTLSVKSVGTNPTTVTPTISIDGNTIKSNQIYLGKNQEIQIHYQVRIQTENEDFHPNFWYQMNGRTTFQPSIDTDELAEFGIPSAKAPGVNLHIKKLWEEFDNNPANRPDQVTFEIQRNHTTDAAAWKNGYIRITKPTKDTANTWERADVEKLSANSGESYQEILSLPQYNNQGQAFSYQTIKELPVPGYDSQQINALTWKNTKQFTPLDLKITKNSSTGEKDLIGAVFKLTGDSIDTLLTDNGDGTYSLPENVKLQKEMTYTLTETKAPEGHELSKKTTWKIKIASNGTVTVDGKIVTTSDDTIQLTIENPFIEIPIAVRKYTMQGTGKEMNLKGAAFALQKKETNGAYQPMDNQTTNEKGLAIFDSLTPGEYRVVETAGPAGYDTSPGNYEFQIDKYGKIIYTGKNIETTNGMWTLTHQNRLKAFDLTVHKKEDNGQALKGAKFRLQGPEIDLELPKDGQETDTFLFENLKPGTYKLTETFTPGGYQGLKDPVTIIIKEDGSIQVEGQDYESVLSPGAKNNQISLDITNQAKVPLPETGGIGRLGIYLVGMIGCTFSIWYLFFKKERGGS